MLTAYIIRVMPPPNVFPIVTRSGTVLGFEKKTAPPIPLADVVAFNREFRREFKVRVRNARYTNEYNCHGLTFAAKLGWFYDVRTMLTGALA